ncbi:hypothetical protein [Jeongeupia naejangsanensis]|uniref:Uncharacterized protein n=1 Tax=Jeongeupia naejangsanensis TaxID=613195 RepID=A0ABS2BPS2_9NEIS|nr:hypothetical protein [Jeongeupia naejangsanensis]MBM3117568.1 hypothetical protein [Jeongeupia naejangsanensis]
MKKLAIIAGLTMAFGAAGAWAFVDDNSNNTAQVPVFGSAAADDGSLAISNDSHDKTKTTTVTKTNSDNDTKTTTKTYTKTTNKTDIDVKTKVDSHDESNSSAKNGSVSANNGATAASWKDVGNTSNKTIDSFNTSYKAIDSFNTTTVNTTITTNKNKIDADQYGAALAFPVMGSSNKSGGGDAGSGAGGGSGGAGVGLGLGALLGLGLGNGEGGNGGGAGSNASGGAGAGLSVVSLTSGAANLQGVSVNGVGALQNNAGLGSLQQQQNNVQINASILP